MNIMNKFWRMKIKKNIINEKMDIMTFNAIMNRWLTFWMKKKKIWNDMLWNKSD